MLDKITLNPTVQRLNDLYNWAIALGMFLLVGPIREYLSSGQVFSWQGLGAAVVAGVVTYVTTKIGIKTPTTDSAVPTVNPNPTHSNGGDGDTQGWG